MIQDLIRGENLW